MDRDSFINALNVGTTFVNGKHNKTKLDRYADGRYTLSGDGFFTCADSYEFAKDDPDMILFTKKIMIEKHEIGILKFLIICSDWVVE